MFGLEHWQKSLDRDVPPCSSHVLLDPPMPLVHTPLPSNAGERNLAVLLKTLPDPKLHLWFDIKLPSVRQMDVLLWHEDIGVFVIEVKAVTLDMIEEFGMRECKIRYPSGVKIDSGPHHQALEQQLGLRNYLSPKVRQPYLTSTACWPQISREAWNRRWDNERVCGAFSDSMIFREDLTAGASALRERLAYVRQSPPLGEGAQRMFFHRDEDLQALSRELSPEARPKPAPSDLARLRAVEHAVASGTKKEASPSRQSQIIYSGRPGTGKTFRLLRIAHDHVLAGRKVLFACYNKVLAADLRRMMSHSEQLELADGELDIRDVFEVLKGYASHVGLSLDADGPEEWGELIAEEMNRQGPIKLYDTVLVDEAQDMQDWALRMLASCGGPHASVCVAAGAGQELYGPRSDWLREFGKTARVIRLNRNFRNTRPVYQFAQTFYEARLDSGQIQSVLRRFVSATDEQTVLFDRPEGQPPELRYLDDSKLNELNPASALFAHEQHALMSQEYRRVIEQQLEALRSNADERPMDLLILVPGEDSHQHVWVRGALDQLGPEIEYIDYAVPENRRRLARPTMIRICTFHSARGIEGTRVLVLGLEQIEKAANKEDTDVHNLAYIVLSRALFESVIAIRRIPRLTRVATFVESILSEMRQAGQQPGKSSDPPLLSPIGVELEVEHPPLGVEPDAAQHARFVDLAVAVVSDEPARFEMGEYVWDHAFGFGTITYLVGKGDQVRGTVNFKSHGPKTFTRSENRLRRAYHAAKTDV
jgi:hypothetical protein